MSKGKLSSEELRLQLAENIPGSVQIFAKALNMSEAEMFKQMEMGKILSADIMPAVAKEFARSAREGGALGAATKKTRAELNRFKNALIEVQDAIFTGGFGEGLAYAFKGMADFLQSTKDIAVVLGVFLKGALATLTLPFELLGVLLKKMSIEFNLGEDSVIRFTAALMGSVAAVWALFKAWSAVKGVMGFVKSIGTAAGTAAGTAVGATAGATVLGTTSAAIGSFAVADTLTKYTGLQDTQYKINSAIENIFKYGSFSRPQTQNIEVTVRDGKVEGLIEAKVLQSNTENLTSILASGTK